MKTTTKRLDPLLVALGLVAPPEGAVPDDVADLLVDHLETFLRGGGRLSWTEWLNLSDVGKVALSEAGDRVRLDLADDIADALLARLDGTIERAELDAAARAILKKGRGS